MKNQLAFFVFFLLRFIAAAQGEHPFELKGVASIFSTPRQFGLSAEYFLDKDFALEAGVGFIKRSYEGGATFDTTFANKYKVDSKQSSYYVAGKFYFSDDKIGQKWYLGAVAQYAYYSSYKRDNQDYSKPYNYSIGTGVESGYKWLIWKKLVAELSARMILSLAVKNDFPRPSGGTYTFTSFDLDLILNAKIGYRF